MRKVIDLCLDMPMDAGSITQTLRTMCLDPNYSGYKHTYAAKIAEGIGLNISDLDYYIHEQIRDNDPKGIGPFILAGLELSRE